MRPPGPLALHSPGLVQHPDFHALAFFSRSLERCGWTKTSPDVSRFPPPSTTRRLHHHARERPQALALRGEVTGACSRDHVTALALAAAVPPTLAPGLAP